MNKENYKTIEGYTILPTLNGPGLLCVLYKVEETGERIKKVFHATTKEIHHNSNAEEALEDV